MTNMKGYDKLLHISASQIQEVAGAMPETHYEFIQVFSGEYFHQFEKEILELIADFL